MKTLKCPYCKKPYIKNQSKNTIMFRCKGCKVMMLVDTRNTEKSKERD